MSIDKIKRFMADHKKELIATTVVVGGTVLVILGCKRLPKKHTTKSSGLFGVKDIPIPEGLKVWNTTDLWRQGEYLDAIIDSIPMDDLGELGEQFIENGLAEPGDIATIIIGIKSSK